MNNGLSYHEEKDLEMMQIMDREEMKADIKKYPKFVRFGEIYSKIINEDYIIKVDDWSFSKQIEWVPTVQFDPFGNEGWKFITEDQFNEAHLRVNDFLNSFLPVPINENL